MADGLFIKAPPSSPFPSLCLSFHYLPALPLSFILVSSHLLSHIYILCIFLSLCYVSQLLYKTFIRFSYLEPLTHSAPLFSASFNLPLPRGCSAALSSPPHLALAHLQITLGKISGTTTALCRWLLSSDEAAACYITLHCNFQFCCRILILTSLQRLFSSAVLNNSWRDASGVFVMSRRRK